MPVVDVHTHMYPPSYLSILRSRSSVPMVREFPPDPISRLIILPGEDETSTTARGRPIGPEYSDIDAKIAFMDFHGIDISIISLANPWVDFVSGVDAAELAGQVNDELNGLCGKYPGRLFAFGSLPLKATADLSVAEVQRLHKLKFMRGVIMGSGGMGQGLDDRKLDPIWKELEDTQQMVFIHPHYGLPKELYGPRAEEEYGHVLPLALGFPMETTIAVTRMILGGVFERFPRLKVLLAHSGGTLPFLAGRIESCIAHDAHLASLGKSGMGKVTNALEKNIWLDAVIYGELGIKAAVEVSGWDRVMFGKIPSVKSFVTRI